MEGSNDAGVRPPVMSLRNSSSVKTDRQFGRYFGNWEARCFRCQRGRTAHARFISITIISPFSGFTANCTFEPPVSTPISRNTANEALRMIWYSLSVNVCAGATVMESPVCTPIGSKFSIEQIMMKLSFYRVQLPSRTLSNRETDRSINSSCVGDASKPRSANRQELVFVVGNAAARTAHRERRTNQRREADLFLRRQGFVHRVADKDFGQERPIFSIASLKRPRSSALSIVHLRSHRLIRHCISPIRRYAPNPVHSSAQSDRPW